MRPEMKLTALADGLTLEEKVALLTGADFWSLPPRLEIGLRAIRLSDGPSGVRGTAWDERDPSLLFPNATALAATWDPEEARRAGALMGAQARDKGVDWLLAPTVNIHRTPLGGRHFECYSEDPLLASEITAGFVEGVQGNGVAATVKHFIGNESETERMTCDSRIPEKALREVYLPPFEAGVRAGAWSVMASYNSVGGTSLTENRRLLTDVLKEELGFDGVVVSDWMATRSTAASANAGLDVVMPGPGGPWGASLVEAVRAGAVSEDVVDAKVLRLLRLADRVGALGSSPGSPGSPESPESPEEAPLPRTPADAEEQLADLAARAMVVLRNEDGILPLRRDTLRSVAVIGPNAARLTAQGGGSAHVDAACVIDPLAGLRAALGAGTRIVHEAGAVTQRLLPAVGLDAGRDPETGEPGFRVDFYGAEGAHLGTELRFASRLVFLGTMPPETAEIRMRTRIAVAASGTHSFSISGAGLFTWCIGDGPEEAVAIAGDSTDPAAAIVRPPEHRVSRDLVAGGSVLVELRASLPAGFPLAVFGLNHREPGPTAEEAFTAAVAAARGADVAVVVVGTTDEIESEGSDRPDLRLPGRQDELVAAVAAVNPRTVVVVNAGAPVEMPWRDDVAAILWAWLPGQEGGRAIAAALTGEAEPAGRLPTTFPSVADDAPVLSPLPVDGVIDYAEGSLVGYRAYAARGIRPAFPFGHGLGYTDWEYEDMDAAPTADGGLDVAVTVRNTGAREGREIVQLYLGADVETGPWEGGAVDGSLRLVGFAAVVAQPGEVAVARIAVTRRALERWDEEKGAWRIPEGFHRLTAARSAADHRTAARLELPRA